MVLEKIIKVKIVGPSVIYLTKILLIGILSYFLIFYKVSNIPFKIN